MTQIKVIFPEKLCTFPVSLLYILHMEFAVSSCYFSFVCSLCDAVYLFVSQISMDIKIHKSA